MAATQALVNRAPRPVSGSYYWNSSREGRYRSLGRSQWAWHQMHGHQEANTKVEAARPWSAKTAGRSPVLFQWQTQGNDLPEVCALEQPDADRRSRAVVCVCVRVRVRLPACRLTECPSVRPSVRPSVCLSARPCPSVCLIRAVREV
eukprot:SAG22_NODE_16_length_32723_cov_26.404825_32_plen_147_part_00